MGDDFEDLLGFVGNPKAEVRKIAIQALVPYTAKEDYVKIMENHPSDIIQLLCRRLGDEESIASDALQCLINLSSDGHLRKRLVELDIISKIGEGICDFESPLTYLQLALVGNITALSPQTTALYLQTDDEIMCGYYLNKVFTKWLSAPSTIEHLPILGLLNLMTNAARLPVGRKLLAENPLVLSSLQPMIGDPYGKELRHAAARLCRNLLFSPDQHEALLSMAPPLPETLHDIVLAHQETDDAIRFAMLEALNGLARSQVGNNFFDMRGSKAALEALHKEQETDPQCKELMARLIKQFDDVQDAYEMPEPGSGGPGELGGDSGENQYARATDPSWHDPLDVHDTEGRVIELDDDADLAQASDGILGQ
eukprot:gene3804-4197_t